MLTINKKIKPEYFTNLQLVYDTVLTTLGQPKANLDVNLYFMRDGQMRKLNREFRNIDRTTDVLSFPMTETKAGKKVSLATYKTEMVDDHLLLGEIFISRHVARRQAKQYGHSLMHEICFLFCHGMLHILGYDHIEDADREIMEEMQTNIMNKCNIKRGE